MLISSSAQPVPDAKAGAATNTTAQTGEASQQRRGPRGGGPERGVYKARISPMWFQDNTRFWYRNDLRDGAKEFIVVDAEKGARRPAFDHANLAAALSKAAGEEFKADHLPFSEIGFIENSNAIKFDAASKTWQCDLNTYECKSVAASSMTNASLQLPTPEFERQLLAVADGHRNLQRTR